MLTLSMKYYSSCPFEIYLHALLNDFLHIMSSSEGYQSGGPIMHMPTEMLRRLKLAHRDSRVAFPYIARKTPARPDVMHRVIHHVMSIYNRGCVMSCVLCSG